MSPLIKELYIPEDKPVTKEDFIDGLKFDTKAVIRIAYSSSFTTYAIILYTLIALFNSFTVVVFAALFNTDDGYEVIDTIKLFNGIYYALLFYYVILTIVLEFMFENTNLGIDYKNGIRLGGFLSLIFVIRGLLSILYNGYIRLFITGSDAEDLFFIFEIISWFIAGLLFLVHLIRYLSTRLPISGLYAFMFTIVAGIMASFIFISFVLPFFVAFAEFDALNYIFAFVALLIPIAIFLKNQENIKADKLE